MLKRVTLCVAIGGASLLAGVEVSSQGGYKIVVNPSNPTTSLSKAQVSNLFLRKTTTWDSGEPVLPVDQTDASPLREAFCRDVLGMSPSAAEQAAASRGEKAPSVATDREVLAYVRLKPGAIGYVSSSTPADGVKVVSFGGRSGSSGGASWEDAVKIGGAVPMPAKTVHVPPLYPQRAREARQEGTVDIEVLVGPNGSVEDTKIIRPAFMFNDAALDAVRQWKFAPTVINGTAVTVRMVVHVTFALH